MGNTYEMMAVAESCPKYRVDYNIFESSTGEFSKSCKNCINFKDGMCKINYYDNIVKSLDQC